MLIIPSSPIPEVFTSIARSEKFRFYVKVVNILPAIPRTWCITDDRRDAAFVKEQFTWIFTQLSQLREIIFTDSIKDFKHYDCRPDQLDVASSGFFYPWKNLVWEALAQAITTSGVKPKALYCNLDLEKNPLHLENLTVLASLGLDLQGLRLPISEPSSSKDYSDVIDTIGCLVPSPRNLDLSFTSAAASRHVRFTSSAISTMSRGQFLKDASKLEELRLYRVELSWDTLRKWINEAKSLKNLSLEFILLTAGTWRSIIETIHQLPHLKHLFLNHLLYPKDSVVFKQENIIADLDQKFALSKLNFQQRAEKTMKIWDQLSTLDLRSPEKIQKALYALIEEDRIVLHSTIEPLLFSNLRGDRHRESSE